MRCFYFVIFVSFNFFFISKLAKGFFLRLDDFSYYRLHLSLMPKNSIGCPTLLNHLQGLDETKPIAFP